MKFGPHCYASSKQLDVLIILKLCGYVFFFTVKLPCCKYQTLDLTKLLICYLLKDSTRRQGALYMGYKWSLLICSLVHLGNL